MGTVVGRVTLSVRNKRFVGERLLLTLPWTSDTFDGKDTVPISAKTSPLAKAARLLAHSLNQPLWTPTAPHWSTTTFTKNKP
jgi:hypothetical protein